MKTYCARLVSCAGLLLVAGDARELLAQRDYRFDGKVSRAVLENYLSRSITMTELYRSPGNLDDDIRTFFGSHEPIIIPFMAFMLGQTINLKSVVTAGVPGMVLGVTVVVVTGAVCILADRLLGGTGIAGAAASSTAGNSAAVPQAVALADTSYAPVAEAATVQVAASVIVTAVLTPLLTSWWYRKVARERAAMTLTAEVLESGGSPEPVGSRE